MTGNSSKTIESIITGDITPDPLMTNAVITSFVKATSEGKNFLQQFHFPMLDDLLTRLITSTGKKSFLVFRNNKYVNILTENIAFFYIRYESTMIVCFDKQEYFLDHSLDQVQSFLPEKQFYRLNRQYLINFNAVRDVEHYFSRKLLVNPVIPTKEKLIVSKDKASEFLHWLDDR